MSGRQSHGHGRNEEFYELRNVFRQDAAGHTYTDTIVAPITEEVLMSDSVRPGFLRPTPSSGSLAYAFRKEIGEELR